MKKNVGTADRAVRAILALVIAALWIGGQLSGTLALVLGLLAVVFLATSAMSYCPLYLPFGFSTKKKES
ncbi:MAG TPA: DUF2892 domain-containing protein [Bacteroidota bacterium]|nr:DUF2892 domain-containing protein [Bacteroidota bacterium]